MESFLDVQVEQHGDEIRLHLDNYGGEQHGDEIRLHLDIYGGVLPQE